MKRFLNTFLILIATGGALPGQLVASGSIVVPGANGSDEALTITEDTEIDLSLAVTADFDASYADLAATDPNRVVADFVGNGVYDPQQWAVVFRYSDVSIAAGATLTFSNHPSRAPVIWLVSGNADIQGRVLLDGENAADVIVTRPLSHAEPGPGGFRGGLSSHDVNFPQFGTIAEGPGFGPGGGNLGLGNFDTTERGHGGNHATISSRMEMNPRPILYGNPTLLPFLGGSGGAGDELRAIDDIGGGGGGGALLIACENTITIEGEIRANGGDGEQDGDRETGGGGGGGIRLVCYEFNGAGTVSAIGGGGWSTGGLGRIRIERVMVDNLLSFTPTPSSAVLFDGEEALIFLPEEAPSAELISLEGVAAPTDPRAGVDGEAVGPDFIVGAVATSQAVIETRNLTGDGAVRVRINPRSGSDFQIVNATFDSQVSADPLVLRWVAEVPILEGYATFQILASQAPSAP